MAHISQSRPDSSLGFQVKVLNTFEVVPSSVGPDTAPASAFEIREGSYLRLIDLCITQL